MQNKKIYNFTVLIEQDESGWYLAKVPDIQGCYTQGKTAEQAMERIREAILACIEADIAEMPKTRFVGVQEVQEIKFSREEYDKLQQKV